MYTHICIACPDKTFIEPGTDTATTPRHAGIGHEHDGSQAADGARRDADHRATPLKIDAGMAQQHMLDRALEIIRERVPNAVHVDLSTSDQGRYGFVLGGVTDADGNDLLPAWDDVKHPLADLADEIQGEISDLNWNGVVGEGYGGYATLDVRTGDVVASS
jgi:hypothetical protein